MNSKIFPNIFLIFTLLIFLATSSKAQENQPFALAAENLADGKSVALDKAAWKFQAGDDLNWANPEFR